MSMLSSSNRLHKCLFIRVVFLLSVWKVGSNIITLEVPCLSVMTNFNCKNLFKISREVKCYWVNVIFHIFNRSASKIFQLDVISVGLEEVFLYSRDHWIAYDSNCFFWPFLDYFHIVAVTSFDTINNRLIWLFTSWVNFFALMILKVFFMFHDLYMIFFSYFT